MTDQTQTQTQQRKKRTVKVRIGAQEIEVVAGTKVSALKTLLAIPPELEVRVVENRSRVLENSDEIREGNEYDIVPVLRGA
jgi:hypothetical protein